MSEAPFHGTREPLLDDVWQHMNLIRIQAEIALLYAEAGDTPGLEYTTRNMVAFIKAAIPSVKALRAPEIEQ